jgi:hypothetical protein
MCYKEWRTSTDEKEKNYVKQETNKIETLLFGLKSQKSEDGSSPGIEVLLSLQS